MACFPLISPVFSQSALFFALRRDGPQWVDLTCSPRYRGITAICAFETFEATSRVDVKLPTIGKLNSTPPVILDYLAISE